MPNFLWLSRRDAPAISDAALAALLAGAEVPAGSARELQPLAVVLAELTGWPDADELRGEAQTLAAFRNQLGARAASHPRPARKPRSRSLHVKTAAAAAVTVLGLAGIASAAYARALPDGLQRLAHDVIGAPTPGSRPVSGLTPASPTAIGHPVYGLCNAWAHAKAHGTHKQRATAFARLAAAAGGPDDVTKYCATAAPGRPSPTPRSHPSPTPHGSGKPAAHPTPHGSGKPGGLPTPHGSGKPTTHPTPHSSGKPTAHPTPHGSGKPGR
jgi:hypothetical protein